MIVSYLVQVYPYFLSFWVSSISSQNAHNLVVEFQPRTEATETLHYVPLW